MYGWKHETEWPCPDGVRRPAICWSRAYPPTEARVHTEIPEHIAEMFRDNFKLHTVLTDPNDDTVVLDTNDRIG